MKLLTRKGLDWTKRFAGVAAAVKGLAAKTALLDGEIIVQDENGHGSFSGLQSDLKAGRQDRMVYYVFDLLHLDGFDLRGAPLSERKRLLAELVAHSPTAFALRYNDHLEQAGDDMLPQACRMGLEGIVSKRLDLPYVSGRGEHWVKSKCMLRQEFVVVGFLPASDMKNAVGSLVLGYYAGGKLMHAGRAGTGFSADEARVAVQAARTAEGRQARFGNAVSRAAARGGVGEAHGRGGDRISRPHHRRAAAPGRLRGPARGQARSGDHTRAGPAPHSEAWRAARGGRRIRRTAASPIPSACCGRMRA